jgi:hypothetical protein
MNFDHIRSIINRIVEDDQTMPNAQNLARIAPQHGWVAELHHDTVELKKIGLTLVIDVWYDEGEPVEIRMLANAISTPLDHLIPVLKVNPEKFLADLDDAIAQRPDDPEALPAPPQEALESTPRDDIDQLPLPPAAKRYARRGGLKSMLRQPKDFLAVNHQIINPTWKEDKFTVHTVGRVLGEE